MPINKILLALLTTTALAGSAHADQVVPSFQPRAIEKPELSGLRYFAKHKQFDRYKAELQRLTQRYPGFVPPNDLFGDTDTKNQELWKLYASGDLETLEAEIAREKEVNPYWEIDENLMVFVKRSRMLDRITTAYENKDYETVIDYSLQDTTLLESGSTQAVWMIGEALAKLGKTAAAVEAYEYGLQKNTQKELLTVLVQKATENLPVADSQYLYERAKAWSAGNHDPELDEGYIRGLVIRTKDHASPFPEHWNSQIKAYGTHAKEENNYEDVITLAWAYYTLADYTKSAKWFSFVPKSAENAKAIEGEILSLQHSGEISKALALARNWYDLNDEIASLYINLAAPKLLTPKVSKLDGDFLSRFATLTNRVKSGEGAEALGWYAYNVKQLTTADAWFSKAIEWELTETAAFGKTLTAARSRNRDLFDTLKTEYATQFQKVADLKYNTYKKKKWKVKKPPRSHSQKMSAAYKNGRYSECVSIFQGLERAGKTKSHDHQMHGWCLMKLDRANEAHQAFAKASAGGIGGTGKNSKNWRVSLYGAALAALKAGRTVEADRISRSGQLSPEEFKTIRTGVLAQQALETFRHKSYSNTLGLLNERARMVPEPANLMELRGWSLFRTAHYRQALVVFQQLDNRLSSDKTRHALKITRDKINPVTEYN